MEITLSTIQKLSIQRKHMKFVMLAQQPKDHRCWNFESNLRRSRITLIVYQVQHQWVLPLRRKTISRPTVQYQVQHQWVLPLRRSGWTRSWPPHNHTLMNHHLALTRSRHQIPQPLHTIKPHHALMTATDTPGVGVKGWGVCIWALPPPFHTRDDRPLPTCVSQPRPSLEEVGAKANTHHTQHLALST